MESNVLTSPSQCLDKSAAASEIIRRHIKILLLLRVIILSLFLGIISLLLISLPSLFIAPLPHILVFIFTVYVFSIVSAKILNHTKKYRLFALIQILVDSILAGVIVYFSGGGHSIFTFLYFFPVISSGLLFFKSGGLLIATFNLINYTIVLTVQQLNIINHIPSNLSQAIHNLPSFFFQNLSIYGVSFYLVALLSSFLAQRQRYTENALSAASQNFDRLTQLYKQIFADISSGIITVDSEGVITSFNPAAENITGYTAHESIGRSINRLADFPLSDTQKDRPVIKIRRKNKVKIPVGYSWARLNMPDDCDDCRVYTLQDLSKIKTMEKKVKQSEKMAAIGEIAAGIAHEFRNPLAAISGAAQVLNQESNTDGDAGNISLLKIILRESGRLEGKINDFLQFSKPAVPEKQWLSLKNQISESRDILAQGGKLPQNCHIETDLPENLECWADPHQLRQIFINLIHNASQALTTEGIVSIKATDVTDKGQAAIRIEISDNGSGMDKKTMRQIFAPFFTTKESGTGLGLAIVQQIVVGHDGEIRVSSVPGTGTTFTVDLPLP